jgi:hypothetical protein
MLRRFTMKVRFSEIDPSFEGLMMRSESELPKVMVGMPGDEHAIGA